MFGLVDATIAARHPDSKLISWPASVGHAEKRANHATDINEAHVFRRPAVDGFQDGVVRE